VKRAPLKSLDQEDPRLTALKGLVTAMALGPSMYTGLKELDVEERVTEMRTRLKEKGAIFKGAVPTKQEIAAAKRVKDRERDLEGIDTSLIIEESSKRVRKASIRTQEAAVVTAPTFKVHSDAPDKEDPVEEEEEEEEDESDVSDASVSDDDEDAFAAACEAGLAEAEHVEGIPAQVRAEPAARQESAAVAAC
jgi:hypothetical protein